jgi:hypothetical protein
LKLQPFRQHRQRLATAGNGTLHEGGAVAVAVAAFGPRRSAGTNNVVV